jgi:hypothetical protein
MPNESSIRLPEPPAFPASAINGSQESRERALRDYDSANRRWVDRVGFTIRQEIDILKDRIRTLEKSG